MYTHNKSLFLFSIPDPGHDLMHTYSEWKSVQPINYKYGIPNLTKLANLNTWSNLLLI